MKALAKSSFRILGVLLLAAFLTACSGGVTAGLEAFQSSNGRYGFFYPTGWTRVAVSGGPEVVFHDVINSDETLSLVVSNIESATALQTLGSPYEVGEKLISGVIAPSGGGRQAELIEATERRANDHVFYDIEYTVHLADRDRHEIATVVIDNDSLFTLAASTNETRWPKVKDLFERVVDSLTFFYS